MTFEQRIGRTLVEHVEGHHSLGESEGDLYDFKYSGDQRGGLSFGARGGIRHGDDALGRRMHNKMNEDQLV